MLTLGMILSLSVAPRAELSDNLLKMKCGSFGFPEFGGVNTALVWDLRVSALEAEDGNRSPNALAEGQGRASVHVDNQREDAGTLQQHQGHACSKSCGMLCRWYRR